VFAYDRAVAAEFPTIRAGVLHATGLRNGPSPSALLDAYRAEQRAAAERLSATPVAELPSIAAWRRVFTRFGAEPTRYRNAAEALLRRLAKHGDIPSIGTLVDLGNLVSVRHAVPVAVIDRAGVAGSIAVRFAEGNEPFTDLGSTKVTSPEPGEVVFVDEKGVVCARRWCWRQSAQSATGPATTEALVVVEGHHEGAEEDVAAAVDDLAALLAAHQPESRAGSRVLSGGPRVEVRPALPADAEAVAEIWRRGWRDGHEDLVPQELVEARTEESFRTRAADRVGDTTVATIGEAVTGFVMVVDDEVEQVYVSGDHRGTGVADLLMTEAERQVRANGHETAWLAVVAGNGRARGFYERAGWQDEGPFDYAASTESGSIAVPCRRYTKRVY
jgi:DNA/RNA-binding domain of Phe-tRNA-synthetase-like protein/ribosomal protein S18 acetylase RimI-like enzyme